jgi:hypothetical protein
MWQLQQQRYLTSRQGGNQLMEKINDGMASWQFFNVSVEKYVPDDCFGGAFTQVRYVTSSYCMASEHLVASTLNRRCMPDGCFGGAPTQVDWFTW